MHDELSALYRLRFASLSALVEHGIKPDGHPAGVQLFLYFWTSLFGTDELVVKLPFILSGIASVWLVYLVGKRWFGSPTGLMAAAFLATSQFAIMYSQIARPYSTGLFFSLLLVYFWTKVVFDEKVKLLPALAALTISAIACCYTHYFSMLFAGIVGLSGFILINRNRVIPYIISWVIGGLFFVPHLPIFFHQISIGGLEWLTPPGEGFLLRFLKYSFHYSLWVYMLVAILVLYGTVTLKRLSLSKLQLLSLLWFATPLLIGFVYSLYRVPVLQFSVLIFVFPYLLLFIFSFCRNLTTLASQAAVLLILVLNSLTLVYARKHYQLLYDKQPFPEVAANINNWSAELGDDSTLLLINHNPNYLDYYFKEENTGGNVYSLFDGLPSIPSFRSALRDEKRPYLVISGLPLEYEAVARESYPHMIMEDKGFTYEMYGLSKNTGEDTIGYKVHQTEGIYDICMDQDDEWGPEISVLLKDVTQNRHDILEVSVDVKPIGSLEGAILTLQLFRDDEQLEWQQRELKHFVNVNDSTCQMVYLPIRLSNVFKEKGSMDRVSLKSFVWNRDGATFCLSNYQITVRQGNSFVYGLIEDMD